jgi:prevent-host-death family protein
MKTLSVGELKARFSEILEQVKKGDTIIISYGRKKEKIAALVPYTQFKIEQPRPLGLLQGRAQCIIKEDFAITNDEFLRS